MNSTTVLVADVTTVSFSCEGSWGRPGAVCIHDGAGALLIRTPGRVLEGAAGREACLRAADQACTLGVLTADPAVPQRRSRLPVVWYVPATRSAQVGPSDGDGPVLTFPDGLCLPGRGWLFAGWDPVTATLTVNGSPAAWAADPIDQNRLPGVLTAVAA